MQVTSRNPISQIDQGVGKAIEDGANHVLSPAEQMFNWIKETVGHIDLEPPKHFENEIPTLFQLPHKVASYIVQKHKEFLKTTSEWSQKAESGVAFIARWGFAPLTFSRIGEAIQKIAEKIVGNIAYAICLVALQVFHPVPYILAVEVLSAGIYLYYTSPVTLITLIAGGILLTQGYFLALLWGETVKANKTLDEATETLFDGLTDIQSGVTWIKVSLGAVGSLLGAYGLYRAASFIGHYVLVDRIV